MFTAIVFLPLLGFLIAGAITLLNHKLPAEAGHGHGHGDHGHAHAHT